MFSFQTYSKNISNIFKDGGYRLKNKYFMAIQTGCVFFSDFNDFSDLNAKDCLLNNTFRLFLMDRLAIMHIV